MMNKFKVIIVYQKVSFIDNSNIIINYKIKKKNFKNKIKIYKN